MSDVKVYLGFDDIDDLVAEDPIGGEFSVTVTLTGLKRDFTCPYVIRSDWTNNNSNIIDKGTLSFGPDNPTRTVDGLILDNYNSDGSPDQGDFFWLKQMPVGVQYEVTIAPSDDCKDFYDSEASYEHRDGYYEDESAGFVDGNSGTLVDNMASEVVARCKPKTYSLTLTKEVIGAYDGTEFPFTMNLYSDDSEETFPMGGNVKIPYLIDGEEKVSSGNEIQANLGKGGTLTIPNVPVNWRFTCLEEYRGDTYDPYGNFYTRDCQVSSDTELTAVNCSRLAAIRKVDQYGNRVEGAKLQILNYSGNVLEKYDTDTEDIYYSYLPQVAMLSSTILNDPSTLCLHEVPEACPAGYLPAEDIVFKFVGGEQVEYTKMKIGETEIKDYYIPIIVKIDDEAQDDNVIEMVDYATDPKSRVISTQIIRRQGAQVFPETAGLVR